ncbi:FecR domain-containing protein [Mucilaginibacter pocheonensis]|uniref:Ferric-dicitrate binding protein FerR (Iron transport regulator) n=1 Tax=Mucilaginibacter pocheonensis TaxID=398050 RepID=A0ABU1T7J8_9SPHI|nr:FecR domain-containing protein [Mucilaginibacter pocheonensis]MDR6941357.1 ferric-dicitrate binding protein FerR (iron transport regulator) [Mucilaginibacter pocheonensis]
MQDDDFGRLVNDESFLNYCFRRNAEDTAYWENWLRENPGSVDQIAEIKKIVVLLAQQTAEGELEDQMRLLSERMKQQEDLSLPTRKLFPFRWVAAASVLIMLSAGLYFYIKGPVPQDDVVILKASDIKAGSNNAILTLANGSQINLNNAANGIIAKQSGINVTKTANGQVIYQVIPTVSTASGDAAITYNTITTPIGNQYRVDLPDGTKVWLNAASSLRYPVSFKGSERLVELTGEGYFEVAHNAAMPFRVKTSKQEIEVLGTHFNINAYTDEPDTKTTLLEGSVKVSLNAGTNAVRLVPGQQALLKDDRLNVRKINAEQAVAWKEGLFEFDHTDLHALMRQVSRWYNVQVVYEGNIKELESFGEVERKYSLDQVLKVLELGGLHFRVEASNNGTGQKRLIVTPN